MPYFPLFIDLSQKRILVVGAGPVGARKIEKLLPFGPQIQVVALKVASEVETWSQEGKIELSRRAFEDQDLVGADLVIVAADDLGLQKAIFEQCRLKGVPCNSVDSPDFCSFIFPALVLRGDLVVAISSGGRAPGLSSHLRKYFDELLPSNLSDIVSQVEALRKSASHRARATFANRAEQVQNLVEGLFAVDGKFPKKTTPDSGSQQDPQS